MKPEKTVRQNEDAIEGETRKQAAFENLVERFKRATDPKEVLRLGDELGSMIFP